MAGGRAAVELVDIARMSACLVSELPGFRSIRFTDFERLRFEASVQRAAQKYRLNDAQELLRSLESKDELGVGRVIAMLVQANVRG